MRIDRTPYRNVHFFSAATGVSLGGVYQMGSLTEANILWILDRFLLVVEDTWTLKHRASGRTIASTNDPIEPGEYDVHSNGTSFLWH